MLSDVLRICGWERQDCINNAMYFLPSTHELLFFMTAAVVLLIIPGPAIFYILSRNIDQGRGAGLTSAAGIAMGTLVHVVAGDFARKVGHFYECFPSFGRITPIPCSGRTPPPGRGHKDGTPDFSLVWIGPGLPTIQDSAYP